MDITRIKNETQNTQSHDVATSRGFHGSMKRLRRSGKFWSFPSFSESVNAFPKTPAAKRGSHYVSHDTSHCVIIDSSEEPSVSHRVLKDVQDNVDSLSIASEHSCPDPSILNAALISKGRYVQIVIPSPADSFHTPTAIVIPSIILPRPEDLIDNTMQPLAAALMTAKARDGNHLRAAPSSIGQSFQYLRDPNSMSHSHRNASQSSLAPSDYTLSDHEFPSVKNHLYRKSHNMTAGLRAAEGSASSNVAGLVCNIHKTTGKEPPALIGAATVISGDKLYVFGGRRLSRRRPQMTGRLYELDLIRRHWILIDTRGLPPPPRYFHSLNAIGDTKLVCYGGMTVAPSPDPREGGQAHKQQEEPGTLDPEITVLEDLHIYDIATRTWSKVQAANIPEGRYAHCATVLPSSSVLASVSNPPTVLPNGLTAGARDQTPNLAQHDGHGGAELIVVGGQDSASRYIEQINVFNLRSLSWSTIDKLSGNYGAYRTVVAPLLGIHPSEIGSQLNGQTTYNSREQSPSHGVATIIYSNYNFLDVKLELKIRLPDGRVIEKAMPTGFSPPGLRFPNGGVINNHFVVSGTYLTSTRQEYAFWALNLKTLSWHRVDTGSSYLLSGSWNRGNLWNRRNTYVILGDRRRSLADDYNQRRTNFSHLCTVELEAFGLYDNPRINEPMSSCTSASSSIRGGNQDIVGNGRGLSPGAGNLGYFLSGLREFSDMEFLAVGGERTPVNAELIANRWGTFFKELQQESASQLRTADPFTDAPPRSDSNIRHSGSSLAPTTSNSSSNGTTFVNDIDVEATPRPPQRASMSTLNTIPSPIYTKPSQTSKFKRSPRVLYLPHTHMTIQALVHYFYTSSLAPLTSPLSSAQVLCSLLQIARPYKIDGLLEAAVERLHQSMDANNTAAIFNAAAMAAGGGDTIRFTSNTSPTSAQRNIVHPAALRSGPPKIDLPQPQASDIENSENEHDSAWEDESSVSGASSPGSEIGAHGDAYIWRGTPSAVVGLQKRGLRGLMEGRRLRTEKMRQFDGASEYHRQSALQSPASELDNPMEASAVGLGIV